MRIFPDIHQLDGIDCNVYVIIEADGLTLVDTGLPWLTKRVLAGIQALGHQPQEVRRILLTHQHIDHIGGLAALVRATGAETWAHPADAPAIEGQAPREAPSGPIGLLFRTVLLPRLRPARITHRVREGATLPVFSAEGGLRVVETPGHTIGHISFYLPTRKLLIAGDAVRSAGGRLNPPPAVFSLDMPMALQSIRKLAAMDVDACLPGHGSPVTTGAQALLAASAGAPSLSRV
ncbi:MAG TPA: MBL fold metallo-hydrolase [Ktedonobacterales bacterium]|jgi:glyoxylase-like metal-dependent hydrolase (beta-lactamase superfamily II)